MRQYNKIPLTQIKQAVSELTREELEAYCILNSIAATISGSLLVGRSVGGIDLPLLELGYPDEEARKASVISLKVQQRVEQLTTEAN